MVNEFSQRSYACGAGCVCMYQTDMAAHCRISGQGVLDTYGYKPGKNGEWVGILLAIVLGYRLLAWVVLIMRKSWTRPWLGVAQSVTFIRRLTTGILDVRLNVCFSGLDRIQANTSVFNNRNYFLLSCHMLMFLINMFFTSYSRCNLLLI